MFIKIIFFVFNKVNTLIVYFKMLHDLKKGVFTAGNFNFEEIFSPQVKDLSLTSRHTRNCHL